MISRAACDTTIHMLETSAADERSPNESQEHASTAPLTLVDMQPLALDEIASYLPKRDLEALELALPGPSGASITRRLNELRCLHDTARLSTLPQIQGALTAIERLAPKQRIERLLSLGQAIHRMSGDDRDRAADALEGTISKLPVDLIDDRLLKMRCQHHTVRLSTLPQLRGVLASIEQLAPTHRTERLLRLGQAIYRMPVDDRTRAADALVKAIARLPADLTDGGLRKLAGILSYDSPFQAVMDHGHAEEVGRLLGLSRLEIEDLERAVIRGPAFYNVMCIGESVELEAAALGISREESIHALEEYALFSPRFQIALRRGASAQELEARFGLRCADTLSKVAYLIKQHQAEPAVDGSVSRVVPAIEDIDRDILALRARHARDQVAA